MQRRTKIVATLGPASDDAGKLRKMIEAGVDVARINFSHGDEAAHRRRADALRTAAEACGCDVGLMGDLQGPKIRIKRFENGSVVLSDGVAFFLDFALGLSDGNQDGVGVALDTLHEDVSGGDVLLLNDGMITLTVDRVEALAQAQLPQRLPQHSPLESFRMTVLVRPQAGARPRNRFCVPKSYMATLSSNSK